MAVGRMRGVVGGQKGDVKLSWGESRHCLSVPSRKLKIATTARLRGSETKVRDSVKKPLAPGGAESLHFNIAKGDRVIACRKGIYHAAQTLYGLSNLYLYYI